MDEEKLYNIYRRHHDGQGKLAISEQENADRKTIGVYLERFFERGLGREADLCSREEFSRICCEIMRTRTKVKPGFEVLEIHSAEILSLVDPENRDAVKPKTAYRIVKKRYELSVSYETFKRFMREKLPLHKSKRIIRIETAPGQEAQIDYGKMGLLYDPVARRNRIVWAFIYTLSCSRLPFVEFVYSQNQESFAVSFINAFEFYDGVPAFLTIDNLKSGIIKPDLYEPEKNRSLDDMVQYYGTFINAGRVRRPTDKGKVERMVPVVRELFLELKHLHPDADLARLNELACEWCLSEYGQRPHGTTHIAPAAAFDELEKSALKNLPPERFVTPVWKQAKVHPDQFVQFEKKRYSLPPEYRSRTVMIAKKGDLVHIFHEKRLVRTYRIPKGARAFEKNDFPEVLGDMILGEYPKVLLNKARALGADAFEFIEAILTPQAYLNARRAQGMLAVMGEFSHIATFAHVCRKAKSNGVVNPKRLRGMFDDEVLQMKFSFEGRSETGEAMIRDAGYYFK